MIRIKCVVSALVSVVIFIQFCSLSGYQIGGRVGRTYRVGDGERRWRELTHESTYQSGFAWMDGRTGSFFRAANTGSTPMRSLKTPAGPDSDVQEDQNASNPSEGDMWLRQISEYGKARMAKKAIGVLEKMKSYEVEATTAHYEQVLLACEKSDQFESASSIFQQMDQLNIEKTVECYAAVIAAAEKNDKWEESIDYLNDMKKRGFQPSTQIYNSCMWAADKGGHWELAIKMLEDMERENIPRDETTYAACTWACEKGGEGSVALHVIDLMHEEGIALNVQAYGAAIWSCTKAGMWQEALQLFDNLSKECSMDAQECLKPDIDIFTAAIWACDVGGKHVKAVELLKLAKFNGLKRQTGTYDAALSCLMKAGDYKQCLQLLKWMETENVPKSALSYKTVLHALDSAGKDNEMYELYLAALRDGHFSPWVGNTRKIDLTQFTTPVAKVALKCVLDSMRIGKLDIFNVGMICECNDEDCNLDTIVKESDISCIVDDDGNEHCIIDSDFGMNNTVDPDEFLKYIVKQEPSNVLEVERTILEDGRKMMLTITRDSLAKWRYIAQESTNS